MRKVTQKLNKKIVIIGAGLGGLAAGVYAQSNGFTTHIFEHHTTSGGLAATWKRKGYLIDGGIHFLSGHKPEINFYKILEELGAEKYNFIDLKTYGRFVDEKSGFQIDITENLEKLHQKLNKAFPEDTEVINELVVGTRALGKKDLSTYGFEKPIELYRFRDKLKDYWFAMSIWKYFTGKYSKSIRNLTKKVHSPVLSDFLMKIFLPDVPVWFILMVLAMVTTNQMCLLGDGSNEFAKCIERRFLDLGGNIRCSTGVREIITEAGKATGIILDTGEKVDANYVISTADGYHTVYDLLGGDFVNEKITTRYSTMKVLPPLFMVTYGVAREFPNEPWLIIYNLKKPITLGNCTIHEITIRIFNYSKKFAAEGKTVVQVMIEADWDYWEKLRSNEAAYKEAKTIIADEILTQVEKYFPNFRQSIEMTDIATPYTFYQYTRSHKGSIMGWLPDASSMMEIWEKTLPGLENFYHAGQWSMSMGGVPTAIISGRHVIQLICHKERIKFSGK